MLEEYQEWAHFVVIEVIEALKDHFKELVCKFMIDEAIVDVGLRQSYGSPRLSCGCKE